MVIASQHRYALSSISSKKALFPQSKLFKQLKMGSEMELFP
jgi:hypothetical protein